MHGEIPRYIELPGTHVPLHHYATRRIMFKLVLLATLLAAASAGFIPLDYHHYPVVVHKPLASSYSYFHKVDHSVPVIKTFLPAPVVAAPLVYKPLPFYHGLHFGYPHHF